MLTNLLQQSLISTGIATLIILACANIEASALTFSFEGTRIQGSYTLAADSEVRNRSSLSLNNSISRTVVDFNLMLDNTPLADYASGSSLKLFEHLDLDEIHLEIMTLEGMFVLALSDFWLKGCGEVGNACMGEVALLDRQATNQQRIQETVRHYAISSSEEIESRSVPEPSFVLAFLLLLASQILKRKKNYKLRGS